MVVVNREGVGSFGSLFADRDRRDHGAAGGDLRGDRGGGGRGARPGAASAGAGGSGRRRRVSSPLSPASPIWSASASSSSAISSIGSKSPETGERLQRELHPLVGRKQPAQDQVDQRAGDPLPPLLPFWTTTATALLRGVVGGEGDRPRARCWTWPCRWSGRCRSWRRPRCRRAGCGSCRGLVDRHPHPLADLLERGRLDAFLEQVDETGCGVNARSAPLVEECRTHLADDARLM